MIQPTDINDSIKFSVEDTGRGIPDSKIKILFSMFVNVIDKGHS